MTTVQAAVSLEDGVAPTTGQVKGTTVHAQQTTKNLNIAVRNKGSLRAVHLLVFALRLGKKPLPLNENVNHARMWVSHMFQVVSALFPTLADSLTTVRSLVRNTNTRTGTLHVRFPCFPAPPATLPLSFFRSPASSLSPPLPRLSRFPSPLSFLPPLPLPCLSRYPCLTRFSRPLAYPPLSRSSHFPCYPASPATPDSSFPLASLAPSAFPARLK